MRTLLIILSYARASDMVARHWPYFLRADADIMGVGREDTHCRFPPERLVWQANIGKDSYVNGSNLIELHVKALEVALTLTHDEQSYTHFALVEPDSIFLKPLPLHVGGLMATLGGYKSPGFHGNAFFHGPWYVDRETAKKVVAGGQAMLRVGLIENGFPDRWWGLWRELYDIRFTPLHTYSRNRIDNPQFVIEARRAIKEGYCYVHGIKTAEELKAVTEGLV